MSQSLPLISDESVFELVLVLFTDRNLKHC